jgi:hypothetical protein
MRKIVSLSLGIAGFVALAACESDEAFRNSYRAQSVQACVEGGRNNNPAGIDANRFCACMVDGYMQGTPSDRLKAERNQTEPPPAARAAAERCAREILGGAQPPAPAGAANATEPAANEDGE